LAEGRPEEAGQLSAYAQKAAGKVTDVAERVEARGVEGALDDMKSFARRRPGVFLLGAGIAGFATGRLLRAATTADSDATPGHTAKGSVPSRPTYDPPSVAPTPVGAIERRGA
jgi:hypothetical protein